MNSRYRGNFMNSVEGIKNLALVGTVDSRGSSNVALFNSLVHIGATPPRIGFMHRPPTVPKQTFTNIQLSREFTINLVSESFVTKAHQTSARYEPGESEFEASGLTPWYDNDLSAPFVLESPVKIGLTLEELVPIRSSGGYLVIGNVEVIYLDEEILNVDGHVDFSNSGLAGVIGLDEYIRIEKIQRMAYAKKDLPPREIT